MHGWWSIIFADSYFESMCSYYLLSHCGNIWIITSYSPYWFGRQFAFYHDILNDIEDMPPAITLNNVLHKWRICTRRNSLSELYLVACSLESWKHVTQWFKISGPRSTTLILRITDTIWWVVSFLSHHNPNYPRTKGTTWVVRNLFGWRDGSYPRGKGEGT